jgi:hypothetical protein
MHFVPEGQHDCSQVRSAWVAIQRDPRLEGRSKSLSVPNGAKIRSDWDSFPGGFDCSWMSGLKHLF